MDIDTLCLAELELIELIDAGYDWEHPERWDLAVSAYWHLSNLLDVIAPGRPA